MTKPLQFEKNNKYSSRLKQRENALIEAGLEKYSGTWDKSSAHHLLNRTTFGPNKQSIDEFTAMSLDEAVDKVLTFDDTEKLPINVNNRNDIYAPIGESWVGTPSYQMSFGPRISQFNSRWFGNILESGNNVGEMMTLFWHNHFVTQTYTIRDENFTYKYYNTLRTNSLGNFKTLVEKITLDPAMLRYLNGNENIVGRPNENYARELFELFTIGKGPQIGPGNYTNYTEDDVIEAAKVLTGWRALRDAAEPRYFSQLHDKSVKTFSSAFQNRSITNNEENEYKDLINLIFSQRETARFISRKLYRWFVYYKIDEQTESNVIEPLAQILIDNNFEIKSALKALFSSAHFYDDWNKGCIIRNPVSYLTNLYRVLNVKLEGRGDEPTEAEKYQYWQNLGFLYAAIQEMILGEPPGVAGWPASYQKPSYHRLWLTSVSAPYRAQIADALSVNGIQQRFGFISINPFEIAEQTSTPHDPNILIDEVCDLLFPFELTEQQKVYLKSNLLPDGLEDYNWTVVWNTYVQNPENTQNKNIVEALLRNFIRASLNMSEFHLS